MFPISRRAFHFVLYCLLVAPLFGQIAPTKAPAAKLWEKLENVTYLPQRWDDGDSFHVRTADGRELILRLYFVDTCEEEKVYADRIRDQAKYFAVSEETAMGLGHVASAYTKLALDKPFTVWTRWHKALGRSKQQRYYAVILTPKGKDLAEELVSMGLARIYGTKITLYDGRTSTQYRERLAEIEAGAKTAKRGGWKVGTSPP